MTFRLLFLQVCQSGIEQCGSTPLRDRARSAVSHQKWKLLLHVSCGSAKDRDGAPSPSVSATCRPVDNIPRIARQLCVPEEPRIVLYLLFGIILVAFRVPNPARLSKLGTLLVTLPRTGIVATTHA
jgi:hypothetical protein